MASAGITLGEKTGWFGALRWRYLGVEPADRGQRVPLAADQHRQRPARLPLRQRLARPARRLNLLNSKTNQITYAYGSLIKTDNLFAACLSGAPPPAAVCQNGVMDRVLHPIEPLAVRLTVTAAF